MSIPFQNVKIIAFQKNKTKEKVKLVFRCVRVQLDVSC